MSTPLRVLVVLGLLASVLTACGAAPNPTAVPAKPAGQGPAPTTAPAVATGPVKTLRLMSMSTELVDVFSDVGKQLTAKMPGYAVEVSAVPGVAEFNAAMAAKLAAGDPPDIFVYQWGTQIQLYAKGGNVLDLTSSNLIDRIRPIRKPYNVYQGKVYALPLVQSVWGVYYNKGVAQKYGYTSDFPKTWDKFLAMLDTLQKAGLKEPHRYCRR